MSYKTISVYLARPDCVSNVMDVALPLAEIFDAHLTGFHVYSSVPVANTIGTQVPPDIIDQYIEFMRQDAKTIEAGFAKALKGKDIQSEWRADEVKSSGTNILGSITAQIRCTDIVVMGQTDCEQRVGELTADIVLGAGRPALIVPNNGTFGKINGRIVIGWDGSREVARAAFDALPLLMRARNVHLVTVGKGSDIKQAVRGGGVDMAEALARHGVKAEILMLEKKDVSDGEALMKFTSEQDCDMLVMGCYGHSRLRERLFGGVTRHQLENMIVPVFMSH